MADKEQDPYGFIINDCRYSSSQEELLNQVPFAREGEIISDGDISPEMENSKVSRRKLECTDETKSRHGIESTTVDTDSANLGFGGERKLEGNSEEKEEEERVKRQKHKVNLLVNCSGKKANEEEEEDEGVINDVIDADEAEQESESEKKKSQKKRELPRSMFELSGWDEFPAQRDIKAARIVEKQIGNVASSSITSVRKVSVDQKGDGKSEGGEKDEQAIANDNNVGASSSVKNAHVEEKGDDKCKGNVESSSSSSVRKASVETSLVNGKSKGKGGGDETNKCILDALRLLVTDNTAHHDGGGAKVDIFDTAKRCGMVFPTSRFLSDVHPDD